MDTEARGSASETIEEGSKVLIIGAGCSGLALAHGLKKVGIHPDNCDTDSDLLSIGIQSEWRVHTDGGHRPEFPTLCLRVEAPLARRPGTGISLYIGPRPLSNRSSLATFGPGYRLPKWIPIRLRRTSTRCVSIMAKPAS